MKMKLNEITVGHMKFIYMYRGVSCTKNSIGCTVQYVAAYG